MEPVQPNGAHIRHHRNRLGYTQTELGDRVGATARHIARIEAGMNTSPKLIVAIAGALNVDRADIEVEP